MNQSENNEMRRLASTLERQKDKVYWVDILTEETLLYKDLVAKARAISHDMSSAAAKGDSICIMSRNIGVVIPAILACWINGVSPAVIDPETPENRFSRLRSILSPVAIVTDEPKGLSIKTVVLDFEGHGGLPSENGPLEFAIDPEKQPCLILFSSGTTGEPKCIPLSFCNIRSNISAFTGLLDIDDGDTFLCTSPLSYAHGLYNSFLTALVLGAKVLYGGTLNLMNTQKIMDMAVQHKATVAHVTPSMMQIYSVVGQRSKKELPKFRYVICGTAKLQSLEREKFERVFKVEVLQQYGMSEVLFIAINKDKSGELPESVGVPVACRIRIMGEKGEIQVPGGIGEIHVLSQSSYGSYINQPDISSSSYSEGWFKTGDIGFISPDGYLTVTGRSKEIIKKGGMAISPDEIDGVLMKHAKVIESATIGRPDPVYGEEIYSFVVSEEDVTEKILMDHCAGFLPKTHIPKRIVFIKEFSKTPSGKIIKKDLSVRL